MSEGYDYQREKKELFTEDGQVHFLKVRDQVKYLLGVAGAFRMDVISMTGSSWLTMACLDRLVELKEIVKLRPEGSLLGTISGVFLTTGPQSIDRKLRSPREKEETVGSPVRQARCPAGSTGEVDWRVKGSIGEIGGVCKVLGSRTTIKNV